MLVAHYGFMQDKHSSNASTPYVRSKGARPVAGGPAAVGLIVLTATAPIIWGTTYIVTTHLLPEGHPLFSALMRTFPAGLIALAIVRQLPTGDWYWKSIVLGGLNMAAFFPLLFITAQRLPGGVAATLGSVQPLVVALFAAILLRERLTGWQIFWGLAGTTGIGMVVIGPDAALDPIGVITGLAGAASMGLGVVLTKKWGRPNGLSPVGFAGWQLTGGGLLLLAPALLIDGIPTIDAAVIGGYAWLGLFGALLSYTIWFAGLHKLATTPTALLGLLSPLTAAALGAFIAGESFTALQLSGFAVALTALVAGQLPVPQQSHKGKE